MSEPLNAQRVALLIKTLLEECGLDLRLICGKRGKRSSLALHPHQRAAVSGPTVTGLCRSYLKFADGYYRTRGDGIPQEAMAIRYALAPLRELFGRSRAAEFGPLRLKAVREAMIAKGWCRSSVNQQVSRVKRMFKWAVGNELVPPSVHHALEAVAGLRAGRTTAPESEPVKPAPEAAIEATLPYVSSPVAAMIRLQLLTGMRPGEVTIMRTADIDRSTDPWVYRPEYHKTEQHGHDRFVILGPKAQAILAPFLKAEAPTTYLFAPAAAERERRGKLHERRKTPMSCGNKPGSNRKRRPKRKPGDRYDTQAYGHAIRYGCAAAFPVPEGLDEAARRQWRAAHWWHPHQLRHNAATRLRKQFGLDVAQVVLGHATLAVTQVYAERAVAAAQEVMRQVG